MLRKLFIATVLGFSSTSFADEELSLESIFDIKVESASKFEQSIDKAPVSIAVLTADDIRKSGAKSIVDLLKRFSGLWGWTKTRSDMDIGAMGLIEDENPRMLYLVDGQPISVPTYEGMQWPQIPLVLEEIKHIEIVRGGGSALYGANAFTGVINIVLKKASESTSSLNSTFGERGIHSHYLTYADNKGSLNYSIAAGWIQTEGKKEFEPTYNSGDQDWTQGPRLSIRLDQQSSESKSWSLWGAYSDGEGAYPASPGDRSIDRVKTWDYGILQFNHDNKINANTLLTLRSSYQNVQQQNFKPYSSGNPEKYFVDGSRANFDGQLVYRGISNHILLGGINAQHVAVNSKGETSNLQPGRKHSYDLIGAFLEDDYEFSDKYSAILALRYDSYSGDTNEFTHRFTLMNYRSDRISLRYSNATSYRKSDIYNLYYYVDFGGGGYFKGNPNLPSQKGRHNELELRVKFTRNHQMKLMAFVSNYEKFYFVKQVSSSPLQLERASSENKFRIQGVLLDFEGLASPGLRYYANFTYFDGRDTTNDVEMKDIPNSLYNFGIKYDINDKVYWTADYHSQSALKLADSKTDSITGLNTEGVPAFETLETKIGYQFQPGWELGLSVENALDKKHTEFSLGSVRRRTAYVNLHGEF